MILLDPPTALDVLEALRLYEGRLRGAGRALTSGALDLRAVAERSLAVRNGQPAASDDAGPEHGLVLVLFDLQDVADRLKASESTVRRYVASGQLKAVKVGRLTRFRPVDLEEFIATLDIKETA